jgi:hypothetical protein
MTCSLGFSVTGFCKEGRTNSIVNPTNSNNERATPSEFQWKQHNKLSWNDFRGPVLAENDESAAATHCGIGFKVTVSEVTGKAEIVVYNAFYANKSWVKSDAKIATILNHEQGHFDLCEIYTRKLRDRVSQLNPALSDLKQVLYNMFTEVNSEYEDRQQSYEFETTHGVNIQQQKKWQALILNELSSNADNS